MAREKFVTGLTIDLPRMGAAVAAAVSTVPNGS